MPTKIEKDIISGTDTTGHEWDGIKELNTPLPKWWLYTFYASILFALVYVVLYPAIPLGDSHTSGVLGWSKRAELDEQIATARARQADFIKRINAATFAVIRSDNDLLNFALTGGRAAFADNCAPCHAAAGAGRPGFPNLADDEWLWGGKIEQIYQTIQHGARNDDPDAHVSSMPNFGADGVLKPAQINDVAEFVLSLSKRSTDAAAAKRGASDLRRQLRRLPWRSRQGQCRARRAQPDRRDLALRRQEGRHRRPDHPSAPRRHAVLGRAARSRDPQDAGRLRPFARRRPIGGTRRRDPRPAPERT